MKPKVPKREDIETVQNQIMNSVADVKSDEEEEEKEDGVGTQKNEKEEEEECEKDEEVIVTVPFVENATDKPSDGVP